ncbi:MAG: hypothetical protein OPY08_06420 [Nitrosopumilus sp.]|nr:hypothetical protein [Nitrosopumilus sp.]
MTESKKQPIFEKISEVVSEYELTGITKNELVRILQQEGIASRMTFYEYLDAMVDPKGANTIQMIVPKGQINAICFPTPANQIMVQLKTKFKSVVNLLDLIKKYPSLGDCFIPLPNLEKVFDGEKIPPETGFEHHSSLYSEIIHSKNYTFGDSRSYITLRFHGARRDILQDLSIFLTHYLYSPHRKYSKQIQEECIKILTPTFLHALKILNNDYVETINVSKELKETIQLKAPKDAAVFVILIKAPSMPQIEVEFLKILGRYYYTISKQFSKKMELDSCKEQQIISKVIKNFYCENELENNMDEQLDSQDIENIIKLNNNLSVNRDKESELKHVYGFDENSLAIKLVKTFSKDEEDTDDALHIKIYYLKLFLSLDIFSKKEQQIIEYVLKHDEKVLNSKEWIDPKEGRKTLEALFPDELSKYD